jgi:AraC-like DNA-binding protein
MAKIYQYYYIGDKVATLNSIDDQNPVILSIAEIQNGEYGETQPHSHNYLEFFYFTKGYGTIEVKGTKTPLVKNDILIVNSGHIHQQYSLASEKPLTFFSLSLDNIKLDHFNSNTVSNSPFLHYHFNSSKNFANETIKKIIRELQNPTDGYYGLIDSYVKELFIKSIRLFREIDGSISKSSLPKEKHSDISTKAKLFIEKNYKEEITLDDIAEATFVSKHYLINVFKKTYNLTPMRYLTIFRLEESKKLLKETDYNVKTIASIVGFNNPNYYGELFKKYIGTAPSTFRNIQGNY